MKLALVLCLISFAASAQVSKPNAGKDSPAFKYVPDSLDLAMDSLWSNFKKYKIDDCHCGYLPKPGEKVSDFHPNAKYLNDTTLWEWKEVDFGGGWKEKVYGLKPQYSDTLHTYDGEVVNVPIWIKYPDWKKPEENKKPSTL